MENLEEFSCSANDHIKFRIVKSLDDLENSKQFSPSFTHQFFGENEKVIGYKGLNVEIILSASNLTPFFTINYEERLENSSIKGDDVKKILLEKVKDAHVSSETFKEIISKEGGSYFGKIMKQYTGKDDATYQICLVEKEELKTESFQKFHVNMQYLLLFFIDGTSFIDIADTDWEYHIIFKSSIDDATQQKRYDVIGYMTVHNFFCYPNKIRKRISQIFILPPYQRQGHGEEFVQYLYDLIRSNDDVNDLTVEDASNEFQTLRDYLDCKNILNLSKFKKDLVKIGDGNEEENKSAFKTLIKSELKLSNYQCVRVYEILSLMMINKSNPNEGLKYKEGVTKRLLKLCGNPSDFSHGLARKQYEIIIEQKTILAEREYENLEQDYSNTIKKLYKNQCIV